MHRRQFLAVSGIGALAAAVSPAAQPDLIKPHALKQGDTVGLITPSTPMMDPDRTVVVDRTMRYFDLKPKWAANVGRRANFADAIEHRVADLHAMFADPQVRGVFCVRGGYGAGQLLDRIDYDLIRRNPKVFIGYSDITALHLAIQKKAGLVTFHGPITTSRFTPYTQDCYRRALFSTAPLGALTNPPETNALRPAHSLRAIRPGKARGRLIGGNLSLVCATMGTPYEIDTQDRILFLEDVDEQTYNVDRMLTQLRLAGKLDQAAGIVWGECSDCGVRDYKPSTSSPFGLSETVDAIFKTVKTPVLSGLTIGHTDDQLTLPVGVMASLDADRGTLTIEEAACV
ncbi:MAG: LD-carboxypeptidase [Bryobacteraceae bacterium]